VFKNLSFPAPPRFDFGSLGPHYSGNNCRATDSAVHLTVAVFQTFRDGGFEQNMSEYSSTAEKLIPTFPDKIFFELIQRGFFVINPNRLHATIQLEKQRNGIFDHFVQS
jgi:hypothetical protein